MRPSYSFEARRCTACKAKIYGPRTGNAQRPDLCESCFVTWARATISPVKAPGKGTSNNAND